MFASLQCVVAVGVMDISNILSVESRPQQVSTIASLPLHQQLALCALVLHFHSVKKDPTVPEVGSHRQHRSLPNFFSPFGRFLKDTATYASRKRCLRTRSLVRGTPSRSPTAHAFPQTSSVHSRCSLTIPSSPSPAPRPLPKAKKMFSSLSMPTLFDGLCRTRCFSRRYYPCRAGDNGDSYQCSFLMSNDFCTRPAFFPHFISERFWLAYFEDYLRCKTANLRRRSVSPAK